MEEKIKVKFLVDQKTEYGVFSKDDEFFLARSVAELYEQRGIVGFIVEGEDDKAEEYAGDPVVDDDVPKEIAVESSMEHGDVPPWEVDKVEEEKEKMYTNAGELSTDFPSKSGMDDDEVEAEEEEKEFPHKD